MMQMVEALLVFCEGHHDVALVRQVMELFFGFQKVEWKFSEFPAPFNHLFKTSVQNHAARDLSLDMTHKFFLPDRVLVKDDRVVLIFNSGGASKTSEVKVFISQFLILLSQAAVFQHDAQKVIGQARYLFLYDADVYGVERISVRMMQEFAEVNGSPWLQGPWKIDESNPFAAFAGEKALYIWGGTHEHGTLEDILLPMLVHSQSELFEKAASAIDSIFTWDTDSENFAKAVAEAAKRKKSIITVAGQRKKPGMSMNVIIDQARLVADDSFLTDSNVARFAGFLKNFIGLPTK